MKTVKVFTAKHEGIEVHAKIINYQLSKRISFKGYEFTSNGIIERVRPQLLVGEIGKEKLTAKYNKALKTLKEEVESYYQ